MLFHRTSFIGVDPTAGQRPFVYAVLDHERKLLALAEGDLEAVLAFIGGQQEAYVAVSAPRQPNVGLIAREEIRATLSPRPRSGRWMDARLADYQMRQHNIKIPPTPAERSDCPGWMQMGFEVYDRLAGLGYRRYPADEGRKQMLEVYPHASYCVWLERVPHPKRSLEGRLQRQLALFELGVDVPDPMRFFEEITRHRLLKGVLPLEFLYTASELDALAGAMTAWVAANNPEQVTLLGDPREGQVVVPAEELADQYS